jgi:4'-phosphopantetheinyl transferase
VSRTAVCSRAKVKVATYQFTDSVGTSTLPAPEERDVHVWHALADPAILEISRLQQLLSEEENIRAARFRFEKNRNEFVVSRGMLRLLLGLYLGVSPRNVCFAYSLHGKPSMAVPRGELALSFNLSHSDGIVVCAFTREQQVGVDVEKVRQDFNVGEVAERFFSVAERDALRSLRAHEQHEAFFRCWTRKEAYIKARGEGLSLPLHDFDVSLLPGELAALLNTRPDASEAARWSLHDLFVGPGYAAALVVEVPYVSLRAPIGAETKAGNLRS